MIIYQRQADGIADELRNALPHATSDLPQQTVVLPVSIPTVDPGQAAQWLKALGGKGVTEVECVALTRLRVQLKDGQHIAASQLDALGCQGVRNVGNGVWHVLVGQQAQGLSEALRVLMARR